MPHTSVHPKKQNGLASETRTLFDGSMYFVALLTPALTVPQLLLIWLDHKTDGVSSLTWGAYAVASGLWLIYALVRRQRQLILSQVLLFVLDFAVVVGIFAFRR